MRRPAADASARRAVPAASGARAPFLAAGLLLAAGLAAPAAAQEGGPIRTGEHEGFTRVVMAIDPATEWSLETEDRGAELFFPGRRLDFATAGAFDRIPRTRVTAIASEITLGGTRVSVDVSCDCRISASFVGARYLALDVADRNSASPDHADQPFDATQDAAAPLVTDDAAAQQPGGRAPLAATAGDAARAEAEREADVVAAAESVLLEQLVRAADQGLVRLTPEAATSAPGAPVPSATSAAPAPLAEHVAPIEGLGALPTDTAITAPASSPTASEAGPPRPRPPVDAGADAPGSAPRPGDLAPAGDRMLAAFAHDQIAATTVYDRDNAALAAQRAANLGAAPEACIHDDALDVGAWTNGLALHAQTPQLMRQIVGEFDRPDPRALRDLARLYVRFGFGAEAAALLDDFGVDIPDRAMLLDLARTVEGQSVAPDGPLAVDVACTGRHGLWQALSGAAPAYRDAAHFANVVEAFADLPVDMRTLLGPALITRLLDVGQTGAARTAQLVMTRPGSHATPETQVAEARLLAAEGLPIEAAAILRAVAESQAPNAVEALILLTRIAIDQGLALPDRFLVDLAGAAVQQRGDAAREAELRGLRVEALAARGELGAAIAELRGASADLPDAAPSLARLGAAVLAAADPDRVGSAAFAETVLGAADLIPTDPDEDGARARIAERLIAIGLSNAALDLLGPALAHGDLSARFFAARAHLALGDAESALTALQGVESLEALELRAAALARSGEPGAALALLDGAGAFAEGQPYAWASGDWSRVQAGDSDPARLAMASFMAARSATRDAPAQGEDPAPESSGLESARADASPLTPVEIAGAAFRAPPPPFETPSLGAARSLLGTGAQVGDFVGALLSEEAAPPPAP